LGAPTAPAGSATTSLDQPPLLDELLLDAETWHGGAVTALCPPDDGRASELVDVPGELPPLEDEEDDDIVTWQAGTITR
jgi:hypothetical protein